MYYIIVGNSHCPMGHMGHYDLNLGSEILILAGDIRSRNWPNISGSYNMLNSDSKKFEPYINCLCEFIMTFFWQTLISYCKFLMPRPLKWSIQGAHTIISSKNIHKVTKTDYLWLYLYESDINCYSNSLPYSREH